MAQRQNTGACLHTLRRTFFLDDMLGGGMSWMTFGSQRQRNFAGQLWEDRKRGSRAKGAQTGADTCSLAQVGTEACLVDSRGVGVVGDGGAGQWRGNSHDGGKAPRHCCDR